MKYKIISKLLIDIIKYINDIYSGMKILFVRIKGEIIVRSDQPF